VTENLDCNIAYGLFCSVVTLVDLIKMGGEFSEQMSPKFCVTLVKTFT
jgi:hypothetical protein